MEQSALRDENFQLKNEITDLKNAFDLNRDILKILSNYNQRTDPQLHLLMQIISRLTSVNNQVMLNGIDYVQQKSILKQENLKLNMEINSLGDQLEEELERNRLSNLPNESRLLMQEQFNSLSKELMAANEERIIKDQQIQYWKDKYTELLSQQQNTTVTHKLEAEMQELRQKIKRRYISQIEVRYSILYKEISKQNKRLKRYIEELENRLLIFIKAYNLEEKAANEPEERQGRATPKYFVDEREEIRLLKYALNDIHVEKKEDQYILTITQRFKEKDTMNNEYFREKRSSSWPKHQVTTESSTTEPKEREGEGEREGERERERYRQRQKERESNCRRERQY